VSSVVNNGCFGINTMNRLACFLLLAAVVSAQTKPHRAAAAPAKPAVAAQPSGSASFPNAAQLEQAAARFVPVRLTADIGALSTGDRQALPKLLAAARILNDVFMDQYWSGDRALYQQLKKDTSELGRARLRYFWINKSPWDELKDNQAFLPGVPPRKLPGANFYPPDMTRAEFESWVARLSPKQKEEATGFFTVVNRRASDRKLIVVPYSEAYGADLARAAQLLREAAALTDNDSLRRFLNSRAEAFLSNDYYASDLAWMDLDAPLDVTIGPYETYDDEWFGYKAAFEAYINLRDRRGSEKLAAFTEHLQEIEDHLPEAPEYRSPRLGAAAPIRVANEILCSGDAAHGVQTAAYNLPNDDRVIKEKGSKRVMLKNVQEAKFRSVLVPIATRVLSPAGQPDVSFEMFFTHMLAHELMHGLGPHQITVAGRSTSVRLELRDAYSAIEEAKADVTGLFALQYMMDHAEAMGLGAVLPADEAAQRQLYITYLASAFRSLRFGLEDAHGKGMAVQFNYFVDHGAFVEQADGTFAVDVPRMKLAVRGLTHELLTLEATGDYAGARQLLDQLGVVRPSVQQVLQRLQAIPTDIDPVFVTADEVTAPPVVVRKRRRR
jgi:hypothetical protein